MDNRVEAVQKALRSLFGDERVRVTIARDESVEVLLRVKELQVYSDELLSKLFGMLKPRNHRASISTAGIPFINERGEMVQPIHWRRSTAYCQFSVLIPVDRLAQATLVNDCNLYADSSCKTYILSLKKGATVTVVKGHSTDCFEVVSLEKRGYIKAKHIKFS